MFIRYLLLHACKWLVVCPPIKLHESLPTQEANHLAKSHTPPGRARLVMAMNVHRSPASRAMGSIRQPTDPSPSSAIKRTAWRRLRIIGAAPAPRVPGDGCGKTLGSLQAEKLRYLPLLNLRSNFKSKFSLVRSATPVLTLPRSLEVCSRLFMVSASFVCC